MHLTTSIILLFLTVTNARMYSTETTTQGESLPHITSGIISDSSYGMLIQMTNRAEYKNANTDSCASKYNYGSLSFYESGTVHNTRTSAYQLGNRYLDISS